MGFAAAFDYAGPAAVFREHAALSAFENNGTRDFDLGGLARLSDADYDALAPVQWPAPVGGAGGTKRTFTDGRFFTPSGRARFIAIEEPALVEPPDADFPFLLNTGRVRDQWHTMTRTGLSPKLASHAPDPFVEVNPDDASKLGLAEDGFARVTTAHGSAVLRVNIAATQVPGRIFVPIHWNDETAGRGRVGGLVHPVTDPHSGQPDSKAVPAALAPVCFAADGFVLARARVPLPGDTVFAWTAIEGGYAARFATNEPFAALFETFAARSGAAEQASYNDPARGIFRTALILNEKLDAVLFWAGGRSAAVERSCRGMAAGAARRHRAPLSPGGQKRVRRLRREPHNLRVLWREVAGHLGGDRRWRAFDRGGRRAAQCRHKLRIVPARAEANDRGRADAKHGSCGSSRLASHSFIWKPACRGFSCARQTPGRARIWILACGQPAGVATSGEWTPRPEPAANDNRGFRRFR
jgi:formylmethanofuran dehydrogenase subunit D